MCRGFFLCVTHREPFGVLFGGFMAEIDKRVAELESGKVEGSSWEEVKQRARKSLKTAKKK